MSPPFPKGAPTLALISKSGMKLMARMSNETHDFTERFGDPDEAWEALEARR